MTTEVIFKIHGGGKIYGCDRTEQKTVDEILQLMGDHAKFEGPDHRLYTHRQLPQQTAEGEITVFLLPERERN